MKYLLLFLLSCMLLFGLDSSQKELLITVYKEGSRYSAIDGHVFNDTLCAIYLTESSAGKDVIGDNVDLSTGKYKTLFESSLGPGQIRLETALFIMNKFPDKFTKHHDLIHKDIDAYKKYVIYFKNIEYYKKIFLKYRQLYQKEIHNKELKTHYFQVYRWSYREYRRNKKMIKRYKKQIQQDKAIINLLLIDLKFSVKVSALYLIYNYNYAIKHRMWNPWFTAISRYNGGFRNTTYYKRVIKNMRIWKRIKNELIHK